MIIKTFVVTPFLQNCRVVACQETGAAICIDPGASPPELIDFLRADGLNLQAIALTHAHLDHIGGVSDLHAAFPQAEIVLHEDDAEMYHALPQQPLLMGVPQQQLKALGFEYDVPPTVSRFWLDEEIYKVGTLNFKILHTPGHSPGHVIFAEETERKVFAGDCLFAGSIGRTDLPGGSYDLLIDSIVGKILPLGDDFRVYTGHGEETLIGTERQTNPFLTGTDNLSGGEVV